MKIKIAGLLTSNKILPRRSKIALGRSSRSSGNNESSELSKVKKKRKQSSQTTVRRKRTSSVQKNLISELGQGEDEHRVKGERDRFV